MRKSAVRDPRLSAWPRRAFRTSPRGSRAWSGGRRFVQNLLRAVPAAIDGFFRDRLTQHAAGIAYRVLFSLAPLTIVLVSLVGTVLHDEGRKQDVITEIVSHLPFTEEGSNSVEEAITRLASPTSAFGLVSLVVFFWASSGMMGAVRTGLEAALRRRARPSAARRTGEAGRSDPRRGGRRAPARDDRRHRRRAGRDAPRGRGGRSGRARGRAACRGAPPRHTAPVATIVVMLLYRFVPSGACASGMPSPAGS